VELTPEFVTPKGQEKGHAILDLMEDYTKTLKEKDFLHLYPQTKHVLQVLPAVAGLRKPPDKDGPTYVGSQACKSCHSYAYDIWKETPHHHAYQTLVAAKRPSNRQYDGECIVCHTVGFGYQGGFKDPVNTPKLRDVGCEGCHGPASLHVNNPDNMEWRKRMNLAWWKNPAVAENEAQKQARLARIDMFCQKCHDSDNDVTWTHGAFTKKWAKIDHTTPP
jgi:hypothetical protein